MVKEIEGFESKTYNISCHFVNNDNNIIAGSENDSVFYLYLFKK